MLVRPFLIAAIAANFGLLSLPTSAPTRTAGTVRAATSMLSPRSGHTATLLPDGHVLIAGGMRRNQEFYRSAELYDPASGKFSPTGDMAEARVGATAVLLRSGKVLVVGGWIGHGSTDTAEIYDPATGKFSTISRLTTRRGRPTATLLLNGDVLIAGGGEHDAPGGVATAEIFHSASSTFERVGSMHAARISHTATLLRDGRVLIAGGRGESVTSTAEIYDPRTKQFALTGSLMTARYKHTAGLLPDGRVLVAGGSDERDWDGATNTAEIYDPRIGRFNAAGSLQERRFKLPEEAVQLSSGQILVAGGSNKVELYDPKSGSFTAAAGSIDAPWHFMSETRLKDGSVLLAGGYANNDRGTSQTWLYKP